MDDIYIKLPMSFGLEISKVLSKYGIEPHRDKFDMLSLEYKMSELDKIDELVITNPARNILSGLEYLRNLKKLTIITYIDSQYRQNRSIASISNEDVKNIEKMLSLEKLEIINQNGIYNLNLSNLSNLKELNINENANLTNIEGLDKLFNLESIEIYENKNLFNIPNLNKTLKNNKLTNIKLGLLYFGDAVAYDKDTLNIDMECLSKMIELNDNCVFVEVPCDLKEVRINPNDALKFHQKCLTLLDERFSKNTDTLGYIIGIDEYLTRNVTYDYEALSHKYTHMSEAHEVGPLYGSNSSYNAIMYKSATCEGYTRAMIYLLKQLNISSHLVYCIKDKDSIPNSNYALPDDGFHSVVSINDYYNLYCDPAWDASKYNSGDNNYLPFLLLNKEEISRTHTLMYDEKSTGNETLVVPRKIITTYLKDL